MAKSTQPISYFQEHRKLLTKVIQDYLANSSSINLFATNDYAIFKTIESGITRHPLRKYQMEALYILDYLLRCNDTRPEKKHLLEEIDKNLKVKAPFLSYEMATGSGKTMLMGASIYFLNQKFNIKNFLIITPASTDIYQKTIRNFNTGGYESVWADDTPFSFNIITGDNYSQNLFFDNTKDANIFIFNISKFGTNATNTEKTWESAAWQDSNGNSISIKQFLKGEKLVIITDEAHHHQSTVAKKIIYNFQPTAVLEYTATAVDSERGQDKKNQQIVYKYDIRRFLEDGHGKLVRAIALANESKKTKGEILQNEKLKIITLFLIHLLKKKALLLDPKSKQLKPIAFIKVKDDILYTQKVYDYIRKDLAQDIENINIILDKIGNQDLEITVLLTELFEKDFQSDLNIIRKEIQRVAENSIFYYGESDKDTEKKFNNIRKNDVEVVVYIQRLDEGIDLPNIFTMAVINDTESNFKTSVKQIIGRGVRLNKDKREFDDETDPLLQQVERLHIVCDQGKNFEEVILAIQKEFGLNNKYLSFDSPKKPFINTAKSELLKDKYVPHIKADFKAIDGVSLMSLINDSKTICERYIEDNCFAGPNDEIKRYIKYRPDSFFLEIDIFADNKVFHKQLQQNGGVITQLVLTEKETKTIYGMVQKNLHCLPDTDTVRKAFTSYAGILNKHDLKYYRLSEADDKLALNLFVNSFSYFYRNYIEKNYFRLDFRDINEGDSWSLYQHFESHEIRIPEDQVTKNLYGKEKDRKKLLELVDDNYFFKGFSKAIYEYNQFDSYTEFQFANFADMKLIGREPQPTVMAQEPSMSMAAEPNTGYGKQSFWVKNTRNIHFTYGSKKYYPDFIVFHNNYIYVIETKGEIFSDTKKNALLKKLDDVPADKLINGYKGILVFSAQMDEVETSDMKFDDFIARAEEILWKHQSKEMLLPNPPDEKKYITFIPVYTLMKAWKNFVKGQKTPQPDGWLEVSEIKGGYSDFHFATQVKGDSLLPNYRHNDWIILYYTDDISSAPGKICAVYNANIKAQYEEGCAIGILNLKERAAKGKLFKEQEVHIEPINPNSETIVVDIDKKESDVVILGVEAK